MDWLIVFIGIVIGAVVTAYVFRRNFVGTLRVDQSDPTDAKFNIGLCSEFHSSGGLLHQARQ